MTFYNFIQLKSNQLTMFNINIFSNFDKLKELDLSWNKLKSFPSSLLLVN